MISNSVARRYVTALFELASEHGNQEIVAGQLKEFTALIKREEELNGAMTNPTIPPAKKLNILEALQESMQLETVTYNFIRLLIRKGRVDHLELMCEKLDDLERERLGILAVDISTAKALNTNEEDDLRQKLESSTGKKVELKTTVDSRILGGLVARIGSTVYDGSLDHQLALIQQRLGEE